VPDMPHSFAFGFAPSAAKGLRENRDQLAQAATRRAQPGASAKSAERREGGPSVRQAAQDDVSASRRFGSAQSVWRRSFRRVGAPATNSDCGAFFAGAAPEARSRVIRPRRYGVGGLNSGSWKPIGGVSVGRPCLDHDRSHLRRVQQRLRSQVSVSLRHPGLGVPKEALNHVERHTLVHQEAGERMAQIMQSDLSQARTPPNAVPWTEQTRELRREDVELAESLGAVLSSAMAAELSAMVLGLPDFDTGTSRVRFSQSTSPDLARVTSRRRAPVSSRSMMALAAIWFLSALIESMRRWVSSGVRNRCR
jgi:hypothetical protein